MPPYTITSPDDEGKENSVLLGLIKDHKELCMPSRQDTKESYTYQPYNIAIKNQPQPSIFVMYRFGEARKATVVPGH